MASSTIVVGGGVIGLGIAWRAAELGCDVTLIDPASGSGSSGVAAGMLAPMTEAHYGEEALLALNLVSNRMYPEWVDRLARATGLDPGYRRQGTIVVARDADDNAALDHLHRFQLDLGLEVRRLRSNETKEAEPGLSPGIRGGIFAEDDHQIDPAALIISLQAAVEISGVKVRKDRVAEIVLEEGRVEGARLSNGELVPAEQVVIAAGARSGTIAGIPEGRFPVRPVKGQLLHLKSHHEPCPITRTVRGLDVYLVPRGDGRLVIGATMEERGWDDTVTAGAVHDLLRYAYELVPGVTEMSFLGARAGFRPGTPDNAPLLGLTDVPGLIAATGHFRNGILLTPVTAEAIAHLLAEGETMPVIAPFSPQRFARSEGAA